MAALARAPGTEPFSTEHFQVWARTLILDTGQPWELEDFQLSFLDDVFAGYQECWLVVPEGNGKTTLVAGLALYHAEYRPLAQVPVAASSREQAEILYRQAEGFVLRSPALHDIVRSELQVARGKRKVDVPRFVCLEGYRRINHFRGGRIQVMAAEDRTGDGVIPTLGIIDELHRHRNLGLYRIWAGKLDKRVGQLVAISTAGEPGSEFEETRQEIRRTATEVEREETFTRAVAQRLVLHDWSVPEDGDVEDLKLVKRANPFSGITVEGLDTKFHRQTMNIPYWRRFVCDLPTRSEAVAIQEAEWFAAQTKDRIPAGQPVWLGLDVAWKWDTTAAVPLWIRDPQYRLFGPAQVLVPPRDGSSLDPKLIETALLEIHERNPIHTVAMDSSRAEQLGAWMVDELGATVLDISQSIPVQVEEYDRFMEALRSGWLKHSGDVGLTQHALNATARIQRGGDAVFERPHQSRRNNQEQDTRVIDALKAAAMVHRVAIAAPPERKPRYGVGLR